jgi:phage tail protein X
MAKIDYYLTNAGDMWDSISFNVYGSEKYVDELHRANTVYCDTAVFGAGVAIICPDIEITEASPLPLWRLP